MKITIKGSSKEIADLVFQLQSQQHVSLDSRMESLQREKTITNPFSKD